MLWHYNTERPGCRFSGHDGHTVEVLQYYASYGICGIPPVTLLGEKADYELILARIPKLATYGKEPSEFAELLTPIL